MTLASGSERIRTMEDVLGAPLLERLRRGVRLTPADAALLRHAEAIVRQFERMRGELGEFASGLRGRMPEASDSERPVVAIAIIRRRIFVK